MPVMSQPNAINQNVPNGIPSHLNGMDSSHSSRDSSPSGSARTYQPIPSSQLPPSRTIPHTQLPPSASTKHLPVNQLAQNYANMQLNYTPTSSPKVQPLSTSTPLQDLPKIEGKVEAPSPITTASFTHSTSSHFSNVPVNNGDGKVKDETSHPNINVPLNNQNNLGRGPIVQPRMMAYNQPSNVLPPVTTTTSASPNRQEPLSAHFPSSQNQQNLLGTQNPQIDGNRQHFTQTNNQFDGNRQHFQNQLDGNAKPNFPPNAMQNYRNQVETNRQSYPNLMDSNRQQANMQNYPNQSSNLQKFPSAQNVKPANQPPNQIPQLTPTKTSLPQSEPVLKPFPPTNFNAPPNWQNQQVRPLQANYQYPRPPITQQASTPNLYQKQQMPPKSNSLPDPMENANSYISQAAPRTNVHANRYPTQPQQQFPQQYAAPVQQQQPQYQNYQQNAPTYNVAQTGFNKLWGGDNFDLLQCPNILPPTRVETPQVSLGNEHLDAANCHPDIFRCTMTKIPESNALLQKSRLPLGVLIHPFRDLDHLPVIQCNTIVRCRACRTYINPFVFFVDNKRWKCNLCYRINELPEEFQYDPVTKTYGDPSRRPEVKTSTIEYIAPAEYMLRPPQPAVYLFLLDISRAAVESGYLHTFCNVLLTEISNLPGDARTHIGFIAYDSALHFFSLADGLSQPHEMTVLDIDDVFLPCPDNLLVNLQDRKELVTDLLTQLPNRYNMSYDTGSAMGAALQAAHKMMSSTGGRVTVIQSSLPTVGPGALTSREDPSQRAGSEAQHLNPANDFYKRLALECSGQQIAVDLFLINSQYVDLATMSGISRFSGGCMYHFPLFKAARTLQNEAFERSLRRYLTRKIGFEAVMRIRCTRGLAIHTFHGNFFVRSTDLLSLPNVNPDAGFGMQVAIEENLSDVQTVCFQAALLYTSSKGERRIRVHTMCLPVCTNLTDVINSADQQCIVGLLAKMAVDRSMQSNLSDAREAFINVAIDILSSYKMSQNLGSGTSGLITPRCLRLLPLYISALLKNSAFRTGVSTRLDDRVKSMCDMKTRPLSYLIQQIYPDLYPVHKLHEEVTVLNDEEEPVPMPGLLQLSSRSIDSNGAYLLDMVEHMVIIVCPAISSQFLNHVLGVADYNSITDQMYELPILENEHNARLHMFVNYLNDEKPMNATLQIMRDNSPLRPVFLERFIEDRIETALSYHEFLQHLKTQVK